MKRERKTPTKGKSRKSSTSSSSSNSENAGTSNQQRQQNESQVLVKESNSSANDKQSNFTVKIQNADSLAKYRMKNPHIQIQNPDTTSNFTADEISDDDEIWICDVPQSIDINKVLGKTIKLGSKKSIVNTEDGEIECTSSKYDSSNGVYQNTLSVIFQNNDGKFTMKNIKPVGRMMFHEKIDDNEVPIELTPSGRHECTIFPENLTVRHPLFGRDFEDKIKVNKSIQKKLAEAQKATEPIPSSVRLKQEKDIVPSPAKKSKKRKVESTEDSIILKKPKAEIKTENEQDDDLDRIKQIFSKSN